jgi:chemotaxis protein MotB
MEVSMSTPLGIFQIYPKAAVFVLASFLLSTTAIAAEGNRIPPVGDQALAFQGGYILPTEKLAGSIIGARESKTYFSTGDTLYIRFIRNLDVHTGDWVTAYRLTNPVFHPITTVYVGRLVKILGILEITSEPQNRVVEARVIQPLDSMGPGDPVMLFAPPTEVPDQGKSEEPVTGTIVEFKIPKQETAQGEIVYIDLGAQDGIGAGDRLKVIRPGNRESLKTFLPDYPFAELKVLSVQERTATTKIVRSLDAVHRGDFVTRLLGRPRPLDPGLDRTGSPEEPQ